MTRIVIAAAALLVTSSVTAWAGDIEDCKNLEALLKTDTVKAMSACRELAEQGHTWAQFELGWLYDYGEYLPSRGRGLAEGDREAAIWYRKAAEQGDARAQLALGDMYFLGDGVQQDYGEALKWVRSSAEQGNAEAQHNMGAAYSSGLGVPQDDHEAVKWYRMAAEQGFGASQSMLGSMYYQGRGIAQNDMEAERWWRKAAEQDSAEAQNNLGILYKLGRGVPLDNTQALKWFSLAAADGYPGSAKRRDELKSKMTTPEIEAVEQLVKEWEVKSNASTSPPTLVGDVEDCANADYYSKSDPDRGFAACRRLAEKGSPGSQLVVGVMYLRGLSVPQDVPEDYVQAYMWLTLAVAGLSPEGRSGKAAVRLRTNVAAKLAPAQIEEAERMAREWKAKAPAAESVALPTSGYGGLDTLALSVEPFEEPIALRFMPIDHFTYSWENRWTVDSAQEMLMGSFVLEGAVTALGDLMSWSYRLSNIGRDGKLSEWGRVEAVTDAWGEVKEVKVLSRNVPHDAPGLDESNFELPLCCLPRTPVRMGDDFVDWRERYRRGGEPGLSSEMFTSFDMRSVVAGVATEGNRKYLVVEHRGGLTSEAEGAQSHMSVAGYWLIDLSNGLKSRGIMRKTITVEEQGRKVTIISSTTVHSEY